MRVLIRFVAVALAGAALYYAGLVNAMVIDRPNPVGAALVVGGIAVSIAMLALAMVGDGRNDALTPPDPRYVRAHRLAWLVVCVMALVGASWLVGALRQHSGDWTPYHNDAIALNECAARLFLEGRDPYSSLDVYTCYARLGIGADRTTPLRSGLFARDGFYPSDDELDTVWAIRSHQSGQNVEFESKPSYPALSFVLIAPWVALGWDTNALYILCLLGAMLLVLARAPAGSRPFVLTGLLGAASLAAFTVSGGADLLYALPLVAAWLWREKRWSGVLFGVACATKQIAWFFGVFFVIAIATRQGWRIALRKGADALAVFAITNLPFVMADPRAWLAGVTAPVVDPMFPRGAGIIFLAVNHLLPLWPPLAYTGLEAAAYGACLALAWRTRRTSPELGVVLATLPLFFAYRSLFSYFFLLPLLAFAGLVRLPAGDLDAGLARAAGAVTPFALPNPIGRPGDRARAAGRAPAAAD
ncbi:MAG: glycosyltransferase 87 family protein [Candidatus Limnocylindria bacterium]